VVEQNVDLGRDFISKVVLSERDSFCALWMLAGLPGALLPQSSSATWSGSCGQRVFFTQEENCLVSSCAAATSILLFILVASSLRVTANNSWTVRPSTVTPNDVAMEFILCV
jgi:hypothetical protein